MLKGYMIRERLGKTNIVYHISWLLLENSWV